MEEERLGEQGKETANRKMQKTQEWNGKIGIFYEREKKKKKKELNSKTSEE